ncbi:MAG: CRISPR-associated helicase Cas3' [Lachnospiraceae bacterium]|nr:CRISPR-associated helicase Cas3' [Lachnospiraceae bacterium]
MNFIAHTKDGKTYIDDEHSQSLKAHLQNVSRYAGDFSSAFNAREAGEILGLAHDIGKYQNSFQERIRGSRKRVDHATLGAKLLEGNYGDLGYLYGMVVAAHHSGLKDSGSVLNMGDDTYASRINNYKGEDVDFSREIYFPEKLPDIPVKCDRSNVAFAFATYLRMLYSSLVDADWTDTEEYIKSIKREGIDYSIIDMHQKLLESIPSNDGSYINNIRADILYMCRKAASSEQGLFTLTVPTGGGKTLSSFAFALEHAIKHNLKRIIYVIPYTSIIEQNAEVISSSIGREHVFEHHSNAEPGSFSEDERVESEKPVEDSLRNPEEQLRIRWASENWDIPVILTTNVQFFESFYSNKPSKSRKLHNIAESVIIFDEAQMLPRELLSPSMYAICELVKNYRVTSVLCSATQPAIANYKYKNIPVMEIMDNPKDLFEKLRRVKYEFAGRKDDEDILVMLKENRKVLCIVNSRRHAHALYQIAKQSLEGNVYHLSTLMTPLHRREALKEIRELLKSGEDVIVISTSLIEAGVDIDFPVVIRSIAGLDSIIQAAGRANREGKLESGKVIIFDPDSKDGRIPSAMQAMASITREVISVLNDRAFELEGIKMYFELLYSHAEVDGKLDSRGILNEFEISGKFKKFNFESAAQKYKIIEDNTRSIIVNTSAESEKLVKKLRLGIFSRDTIRKLQQHSVSVYENEYRNLRKDNALEELNGGYIILNNPEYYKDEFGLDIFTDDNKNAGCNFI